MNQQSNTLLANIQEEFRDLSPTLAKKLAAFHGTTFTAFRNDDEISRAKLMLRCLRLSNRAIARLSYLKKELEENVGPQQTREEQPLKCMQASYRRNFHNALELSVDAMAPSDELDYNSFKQRILDLDNPLSDLERENLERNLVDFLVSEFYFKALCFQLLQIELGHQNSAEALSDDRIKSKAKELLVEAFRDESLFLHELMALIERDASVSYNDGRFKRDLLDPSYIDISDSHNWTILSELRWLEGVLNNKDAIGFKLDATRALHTAMISAPQYSPETFDRIYDVFIKNNKNKLVTAPDSQHQRARTDEEGAFHSGSNPSNFIRIDLTPVYFEPSGTNFSPSELSQSMGAALKADLTKLCQDLDARESFELPESLQTCLRDSSTELAATRRLQDTVESTDLTLQNLRGRLAEYQLFFSAPDCALFCQKGDKQKYDARKQMVTLLSNTCNRVNTLSDANKEMLEMVIKELKANSPSTLESLLIWKMEKAIKPDFLHRVFDAILPQKLLFSARPEPDRNGASNQAPEPQRMERNS